MFVFVFSSRRRHTRCALVTGVQTCALPILIAHNIPINKGWNMQMTLAAEFYAGTRSKAPVLDIVRIGNGNREQVETIHVINKREARTIAKAMGATPWNF